eukprot:125716_1
MQFVLIARMFGFSKCSSKKHNSKKKSHRHKNKKKKTTTTENDNNENDNNSTVSLSGSLSGSSTAFDVDEFYKTHGTTLDTKPSNLFRPDSSKFWDIDDLEDHEEEIQKQMMKIKNNFKHNIALNHITLSPLGRTDLHAIAYK